MKVLVTGATGFVGHQLVKRLVTQGHEVVILSRNPDAARARFARTQMDLCSRLGTRELPIHSYGWNPIQNIPPPIAFEGVEAVIHLAGEPIGEKRWTPEQKRKIRESRSIATQHLVQAIERAAGAGKGPRILISSSAVGFYGDRGDEKLDETSSAGSGFLSEVCRDWEREALEAEKIPGLRVVRLRTGMVLGVEGGAFARLLPIFKYGAGGPLGSGKQWVSWIHEEDLVGLIEWVLQTDDVQGVVNAVGPEPVSNQKFAEELGRALKRPTWLPAPALALKFALGEMSELVLQSQRVMPRKALERGFVYRHPEISEAIRSLLR